MIGFSEGYLVVVSSSGGVEELGEEISCGRFHKGDELVDIAKQRYFIDFAMSFKY